MRAARKRDDEQMSVWDFIPPSPSDDVRKDLIAEMQMLARKYDAFGVTPGEAVFSYETRTGRVVGDDPLSLKPRDQRSTSWLGRLGREAGLRATNQVRPSPVKRHHKHRHTVYVWPSIRDIQR